MPNPNLAYGRLSTQTNITLGAAGSHVQLFSVNVCTAAASAVITIKETNTSGATIATIDASAKGSYWFGGVRIKDGIYCAQTGGNADVTFSFG